MKKIGPAIGLLAICTVGTAHAEQWTATWKSTNGVTCGDGIVMRVTETSGVVKIHSEGNGRTIAPYDREVKVAPDGSGRLSFKSPNFGDSVLEVPAGQGKRPITQKQLNGICQWVSQ